MYDPTVVNIAVHYRWGDVKSPVASVSLGAAGSAVAVDDKIITYTYLRDVLLFTLGHRDSLLYHVPCVVHMFAEEGRESLLVSVRDWVTATFPQTTVRFFFGNRSTVVSELDHMAGADIFIAGGGSFANLACTLNTHGITFCNDHYPEPFRFSMNEWNRLLCSQPLYVTPKPFHCATS